MEEKLFLRETGTNVRRQGILSTRFFEGLRKHSSEIAQIESSTTTRDEDGTLSVERVTVSGELEYVGVNGVRIRATEGSKTVGDRSIPIEPGEMWLYYSRSEFARGDPNPTAISNISRILVGNQVFDFQMG